jgi:hypothetical protein
VRTVPELRIYRVWDKPIGPHPVGMFEVNVFTPGKTTSFLCYEVGLVFLWETNRSPFL